MQQQMILKGVKDVRNKKMKVMKHKLFLLSLAILGFVFFGANDVKAQSSPNPMFIDDVIHVKPRSPKIIDYGQIQRKIKKQKPKTSHISRFECQAYRGYQSSSGMKRQKTVYKSRKQNLKKVLASR